MQVQKKFGNRPDLILPITLDIANLVKVAGSQKSHKLKEREQTPKVQLIRRNFQINQRKEVPSVSYQNDDRLLVQDSNQPKNRRTREVETESKSDVSDRTARALYINAHPEFIESSKPRPLTEKDRTYHERKLNMTAFTGVGDQLAMASHQIFQIAKPDNYRLKANYEYNTDYHQDVKSNNEHRSTDEGQTLLSYINQNLTLEQIEELAFMELNSTEIPNAIQTNDGINDYENDDGNSTLDENLPTPEKLIMLHLRPRITNKISTPPYRQRSPTSTAYEMARCEKFGNLCIRTPEYPM